VVTVQDTFGNTVTSPAVSVTLAIDSNPSGGTLSVTTNPVTTTNGVESFAGVKIDKAGTGYTLAECLRHPTLKDATSHSADFQMKK
jgi:hypothetical protein